MKLHTTAALGITLLCSASLPALAQGEQNSCTRLQQVTDQNRERFNMDWVRQAETVIRSGDEQICQRYALQAEEAARQLNQRAEAEGGDQQQAGQQFQQDEQTQRTGQAQQTGQGMEQGMAQGMDEAGGQIMVRQPQPEVTVQQQAPQVQVTQPPPQVSVNQQQPQIIVRQAPPTVRLQMPQPVITIDQPEPEIIVRMPPPQVAVNTPEPQVRVTQPQPEVQVRQPQPQVQVQMQKPEVNVQQNRQAQVSVQREQPVIELQPQREAEVQISRQQPKVSYEAAQPRVEFEQGGQPQVQFRRTGEAQVRIEQMDGQQQGQQQASQQQAGQQQAGQQQQASGETGDQPTGSIGSAAISEQDRERIGVMQDNQRTGEATEVKASQLLDKQVVNLEGQRIGTITALRRQDDKTFAVIDHGGALSLQQTEFLVPAERLALDGQGRVMLMGLTQQDFSAIPRMEPTAGQEIGAEQTVTISQAGR